MTRHLRAVALCLFFLLYAASAFCQDISGSWAGTLKIQNIALDLILNIQKTDTGYTASMDSPDQGARGIPVSKISFEQGILQLAIPAIMMEYKGNLNAGGDKISGIFIQRGQSIPLDLERNKALTKTRPQTPKAPYPYYTEEVSFENKQAGIKLAGTLSMPSQKGVYPAVVLISGSGAQDRDETILGHKPFLVLADFLTRNGYAVLRYDDRGTAASSGDFSKATSRDFADDALAAVQYLNKRKEINKKQIGLIGHSEGGAIAPMLAAQSGSIGFIVLLAGPAMQGSELLLQQQKAIAAAEGMPEAQAEEANRINSTLYNIVVRSKSEAEADKELSDYLKVALKLQPTNDSAQRIAQDAIIRNYISELNNPWIRFFLKYNPAKDIVKVPCPVLALYGEKDVQVPAKANAEALKEAMQQSKNEKVSILELPGLNHLFQEAGTGAPSEYATIEQTFSPKAMAEILKWLRFQVSHK